MNGRLHLPTLNLATATVAMAVALALKPTAACADLKDSIVFDVPAQQLPSALNRFSEQAGVQVTSSGQLIEGKTSPGVSGRFEAKAALELLLKDTQLRYDVIDDNTVVIMPVKSTAADLSSSRGARAGYDPSVLRLSQSGSPADAASKEKTANDSASAEKTEGFQETSETKGIPEIVVSGSKLLNVDVVRGKDDPQAYFILDSKRIESSGATSVEEFLKKTLSMNTTALTNNQSSPNFVGTLGSVNLRGVGSGQTLILINGRRVAGAGLILSVNYPPDLNSIPPSAIERIEVLPSSSTGIYGGSAVGGVVNVVLKQNFNGGSVSATYGNSFDGVARSRALDAAYGMSLEDGRTNLLFAAHLADSDAPLVGDRQEIWKRGRDRAYANSPGFVVRTSSPFYVGSTTNVASATGANLTLKSDFGGYDLGSPITHVGSGISASTAPAQMGLDLLANAGSYDLNAPPTAQALTGLLNQAGTAPRGEAYLATIRRQMTDSLELFAEVSDTSNRATSPTVPTTTYRVPAGAPTNPFAQDVLVSFPSPLVRDFDAQNETRRITAGFIGRLPGNWQVQGDYVWSRNELSYLGAIFPSVGQLGSVQAGLADGTLNPFVDTLLHPMDLESRAGTYGRDATAVLKNAAVRFAGPVYTLPAGDVTTTIGLERRREILQSGLYTVTYPEIPQSSSTLVDPPEAQRTDSLYVEMDVPLVSGRQQVRGIRELRMQVAGRYENYKVNVTSFPFESTGVPQTFSETKYSATKPMLALLYRPIDSTMLRASYSTSFLPPPYSSLVPAYPAFGTFATVSDPKRGSALTTGIPYLIGGDPNIRPQQSDDWSVGMVFEPTFLKGFRASLDWYWLKLSQVSVTPTSQQIVDLEDRFPERVTRAAPASGDPYAVGPITRIDTSTIAAAKARTSGVTGTFSYEFDAGRAGRFSFLAGATRISSFERQLTLTGSMQDILNQVAFGGPLKWRGNLSAEWRHAGFRTNWTSTYFGSYRQYDIGGTPLYVAAQGSTRIASQMYHDLTVSYDFSSNTSLTLGVKNVFDKLPPFDAYYSSIGYYSPFGDSRLRSFWLQASQSF